MFHLPERVIKLKEINKGAVNISIFFISFSILSYEIIFTRIFSYSQWHNLSSLIITMALLGFGVSGSVISVIVKRIEKNYSLYFSGAMLLFPVFLGLGFIISSTLDFNPYEITFRPGQVIAVFLYFFIMGFSFFIGASIICIAFLKYSISKSYFINLLGSGVGPLCVVAASFFFHPCDIMAGIIFISMIPALVTAFNISRRYAFVSVTIMVLLGVTVIMAFLSLDIKKVSQYKAISGALNLPDAEVVYEDYSPLAVVQVVEAKGLRSTAGLSLASPFHVPEQKGIFFDAGSMSPVTPFKGDINDISYIKYLASYLPFHVIDKKNNVLVIGAGGGESILKSVLSGFKKIDGVEVNHRVIELMRNQFGTFSGEIYNRENVTIHNQEARSYIKQTRKKYDLIELSMIDAYNTTASGVYALNESYLYTVESIEDYFKCLNETGFLAITRWMVTPPRDNLKVFNLLIKALKKMGIEDVKEHLIAIRSLQTMTVMVSKTPVTEGIKDKTREFARKRFFDLVYYPGIKENEVNQFIELETPVYYNGLQKLFSEKADSFVKGYDFDITAPTDNRPYFYNFFKLPVIKYIIKYGPSQLPVTEWGYLILFIILLPVMIISFIFIIFPLLISGRTGRKINKVVFAYFSIIGVGYFFIEMPLIQKMVLFLGDPSYSLPVVIAGLLVSSGMGSLFSDRLFPENRRIFISVFLVVLITGFYLFFMDIIFSFFMTLSIGFKIFLVLLMIAPQGFFMGIPLPQGLNLLKKKNDFSLAWAWGINGFFSVISILLATITAIILGFRGVFIIAIICYATAGILSCWLIKE